MDPKSRRCSDKVSQSQLPICKADLGSLLLTAKDFLLL